jgi:hypothetical protein
MRCTAPTGDPPMTPGASLSARGRARVQPRPPAPAVRAAQQVGPDLDDLALDNGEGHDREWSTVAGHHRADQAVDQHPVEFGTPRSPGLFGHFSHAAVDGWRPARANVDTQHDVGVEDLDECVEVPGPSRGEERLDHFASTGDLCIGAGVTAPCTRRRARLANCRAAAGLRSTRRAICSKGSWNRSWSTNASRSAGSASRA